MIALVLALSGPPAPPPAPLPLQPWRLVNLPTLHVGARPALLISPDEVAVGVTLQVTVQAL